MKRVNHLLNVPYAKYLQICEGIAKDFELAFSTDLSVNDWCVCVRLYDLFTHALDVVLTIKLTGIYQAQYHNRIKVLLDLRRAYFTRLYNRGFILNKCTEMTASELFSEFQDLLQ